MTSAGDHPHDHDHGHDHADAAFGPHGHGHEHDLVEPLAPRTGLARLLVLAAVIAAVTLASTVAGRRGDDDKPPPASRPEAASHAALAWIDAIGEGDTKAAAERTGPASKAAIARAGGDVSGVLVEAGESYGAWADSADRATTLLDLGTDEDRTTRAVVVVSGTTTGGGTDGYRVDALPLARRGNDGPWLVETWAFPQAAGGRLELVSPGAGVGGLPPDGVIEVIAPGDGELTFWLDDGRPTQVANRGSGSTVRFDPPGEMTTRTHLVTVAYVDADDDTFIATAFTFLVEG